jgi:hypothetical protein
MLLEKLCEYAERLDLPALVPFDANQYVFWI